jgi:hypothetical protein
MCSSGSATVTIKVNAAPIADSQSVVVNQDTALVITLTASDENGDTLIWVIDTQPMHGILAASPPSITYTPATGYVGPDSFTFHANDGTMNSNVATVTIRVNAIPVASSQSVSTDEDVALTITLSASDADGDPLSWAIGVQPQHGTLSGIAPNLTYTPFAGYAGPDSFTFHVNDGFTDSNVAAVSITVIAVPRPAFAISTLSLTFSGTQGDPNPGSQNIQLGNGGDGGTTLNWTAASNRSWLSVAPASGVTTTEIETLTVSVDISGLGPNTYTGQLTFTDSNASNSPRVINVSLTVAPQPPFTNINAGLVALMAPASAWGDWDADGDLDLVITGTTQWDVWSRRSLRYQNTGSGFVLLGETLPKVDEGSVAWGDLENDGDIDLGLTGSEGADMYNGCTGKVFTNNGTGTLSFSGTSFGSRRQASLVWGDYDNDGRLDIFLFGEPVFGVYEGKLYRNTGGTFVDTGAMLPGSKQAYPALGDFDNDGDLDLFLSGDGYDGTLCENMGGGIFSQIQSLPIVGRQNCYWVDIDNDGDLDLAAGGNIYVNNGNKTFTLRTTLSLAEDRAAAWGDYNNDGNLDVVTNTHIYYGDGKGNFSSQGLTLFNGTEGDISCGDYDGDGDLDLVVLGAYNNAFGVIYRNNCASVNLPPSSPTNTNSSVLGSDVTLTWGAASDDHTPVPGLSYNVRVGTSPGACDICSGMALPNGTRLVPRLGNAYSNLFKYVKGLAPGTYYWSVQAIDTCFKGSAWAPEQQFVIP